ncbi:SRPBCC family protein [Paraburkholderia sp. 2C]
MAQALASIEIAAPAERVWQLIGGFGSLPDWLPYIPSSELTEGGRVRRLANPNGEPIVERLEAFDDAARSYSYSILQAPFPVTGYVSTLRVVAAGVDTTGTPGAHGGTSQVIWSGHFTPAGVTDEAATQLFQRIYEDGLKALAERFDAKNG